MRGDADQAFKWIEETVAQSPSWLNGALKDPALVNLRNNRRQTVVPFRAHAAQDCDATQQIAGKGADVNGLIVTGFTVSAVQVQILDRSAC